MTDIIAKIKKANLTGRGGAAFPTAGKWLAVKKAVDSKPAGEKKCYIICNASEGEPGVKKDGYILQHYPEKVIKGIKTAIAYLQAEKAFIYINPEYYEKFKAVLKKNIGLSPIEIFRKPIKAGYIGGEETSAINTIEGARTEPRLRPPFPPTKGLFGCPTLVNNVETFYDIGLIVDGTYKKTRFFTISGDCLWDEVFEYSENATVEKILKESKNFPKFDFFAQIGGAASGEVLNSTQLKRPVGGGGAIVVYSTLKHKPIELIKKWIDFFYGNSCGQCTPCREGLYRLKEIINNPEPNWEIFSDILHTMHDTSFCGLGCTAPLPIISYINNVLSKQLDSKIKIENIKYKIICDCLRHY